MKNKQEAKQAIKEYEAMRDGYGCAAPRSAVTGFPVARLTNNALEVFEDHNRDITNMVKAIEKG